MKNSHYDTLLVPPDADDTLLRHSYQQSLANLVRKLRVAREHGQDITGLEDLRVALEEAWSVLSDPLRRSLYDIFLHLSETSIPDQAEDLWIHIKDSMIDPPSRATLELVALLTDLDLGITSADMVATARHAGPASPGTVAGAEQGVMHPGAGDAQGSTADPHHTFQSGSANDHVAPQRQVVQSGLQTKSAAVDTILHGGDPSPSSGRGFQDEEPTLPGGTGLDSNSLATMVFNHGYSGDLINRVRRARGISLDQVSQVTRISIKFLEAIEADEYSRLPATIFVRGYLKEIAGILGIDADSLVGGYLARMNRARG